MSSRYEIRLSGDIGDGLILIGKVLAEAAAIYDGLNAVQSQSYGEEARGEANRSEVIISDEEIFFPKVERPDLLLCFNQVAYYRYCNDVKPDGIIVTDSSRVLDISMDHEYLYDFPIVSTAVKQFGNEPMAAIVALGIVADFVEMVSPRAIHMALTTRIPKGTEKTYEEALKLGYKLAAGKLSRSEFQS
jgi:2-oxoglutarate ferredoxin oxidoreductase subunit gamma